MEEYVGEKTGDVPSDGRISRGTATAEQYCQKKEKESSGLCKASPSQQSQKQQYFK